MGSKFPFCKMMGFGDWMHDDVNVLSNAELYAQKW